MGAIFAGYRIEGIAGRGGMGVVYRAHQERPARTVALKIVSPELAGDAEFRELFDREADNAAAIEHPNVIPVYDSGEYEGQLFLVMRYIPGTDLESTLQGEGLLAPPRAVAIVTQVCAALDEAHVHTLVHRDVKPANVLISVQGGREHVYLTDFGLAKKTSAQASATGYFRGSIDYAAPEQFRSDPVDARTDVYAVGAVLHRMLTGSVPFPADTDAAKMFAHLQREPPSILAADPSLPPALDGVVHRAMAKAPADRYPSAGDLARAAAAALEDRRPTEPERSVWRGPTPSRRVPGWVKVAAPVGGLVVLGAVVAAIAIASGGSSGPSRSQRLAACMRSHGLARPSVTRKPRLGETDLKRPPGQFVVFSQKTFASCAWPPPPGANPDGYRAITVTTVQGPLQGEFAGPNGSIGADLADRIESDCKQAELRYQFGAQGVFSRAAPFRMRPGEFRALRLRSSGPGRFEPTSPNAFRLSFYPSGQEMDVFHNGRATIDDVRCVT